MTGTLELLDATADALDADVVAVAPADDAVTRLDLQPETVNASSNTDTDKIRQRRQPNACLITAARFPEPPLLHQPCHSSHLAAAVALRNFECTNDYGAAA